MKFGTACILSFFLVTGLQAALPCRVLSEALPKNIPVTVTADKLDYDRANDVYSAVGHVKIEQQGVRLEANKVVMDNKTGVALAEGDVVLQDQGDVTRAAKMQINLNTRAGVIYQGDIFMKKDNFHVKGAVIERRSENVYHVEKGVMTTCDDAQWYVKANELNIDMDRYATGEGVSFNVQGVPVFYTPYFLFPVKRQSGFLIPEVGHSSKDGFDIGTSFFWAISDNKDMTLYSDYRERIGHGTGMEYRYSNSSESSGQLYAKYWDMYHTSESRWEVRLQHQEEFAEDLSGRLDINLVSDEHYYFDLDKQLEMQSKPYLDSNAFYVERWNTASLYLLTQYSTDLTTSNEKTVQKLPELRYTIYEERLAGPLYLNFEGSAVNFTREQGSGLRRADFNPQLTAAFGSSGLNLAPRVGARATFYDRSQDQSNPGETTNEPTERRYVYAGIDLNARISRVYGADRDEGIGRIRHSIEPTVSYVYIPHVDQTNIPQFDALDSVVSMNTTTVSLINRVTAHYKESKDAPFSTFDLMVVKLSQGYNYGRNVNATQDPNSTHTQSDILGELSLRTPKMFSLSATGNYDTYKDIFSLYTVGAGLTSSIVSFNLTEQYQQDPKTHYLSGGTGFIIGKWNVSGQWWRDMENRVTTQEEYKAHYGSQCWGIGITFDHAPGETRYVVLLDLKGLGSFGQ
jgi:LPS-assembly protein